jgi:endogenous inhibitor of DNA gyrase (YacG/DUF329 family)
MSKKEKPIDIIVKCLFCGKEVEQLSVQEFKPCSCQTLKIEPSEERESKKT